MLRHLILVPTELERRSLRPLLEGGDPGSRRIELCGFGMVAAAARTARLLADLRPRRVVLVGIAGRFGDRIPLGSACMFSRVACHGIGVGAGSRFLPAASLGWEQWPGDPPDPTASVGDRIDLDPVPSPVAEHPRVPSEDLLLTVASAASDADEARIRKAMYPHACAEDMEGFAVALACRLARVPCGIVRGISNSAGDRDHSRWQTRDALAAAAGIVSRHLEQDLEQDP